jgi:hypothetical protein
MFGKLLSKAIKVATLPVDVANAGMDIVTGGDGSKHSRNHPDNCNPLALAEQIRDAAAKAAEDIDD